MLREAWSKYYGKQIRGVNWTRNSLEELILIVEKSGWEAPRNDLLASVRCV